MARDFLGMAWGVFTIGLAVVTVLVAWPLDSVYFAFRRMKAPPLVDYLLVVKELQKLGFDELDKHFENKP